MEDEEPVAKIEIHSAKILSSENGLGAVQTLSGEPLKTEQDEETAGAAASAASGGDAAEAGKKEQGGETLEDVLFAPISTEIVKGMRLKVVVGDEEAEFADAPARKSKVSVFSNVDYLLGKFKGAKETAKEEEKKEEAEAKTAPAGQDLQEEVSVVWETNGRTDPHQVWIYPDGSEPQKGLLIKIDRFGGVKVLSGDGREDEE
jgi:hypothetical protein